MVSRTGFKDSKLSTTGSRHHLGSMLKNIVIWKIRYQCIPKVDKNLKRLVPRPLGTMFLKQVRSALMEDFKIIIRTDDSFDPLIHECLLLQRDRPDLSSRQFSFSIILFQLLVPSFLSLLAPLLFLPSFFTYDYSSKEFSLATKMFLSLWDLSKYWIANKTQWKA